MKSYWRGSALALVAAGFCFALGAPAQAGCVGLSGTADGFDKETAVSRANMAGELRASRSRLRHRASFPPYTV